MTEDEVFKIDGSKVWLSPTARAYAAEFFGPGRQGLRKMAKHLLLQQTPEQIEAAHTPPPTARDDFQADVAPSQNIENRPEEPVYGPGGWPDIFGTGSPPQMPFE